MDASVPELDAAVGADALDPEPPLDPDALLFAALLPPEPDEPDEPVAGAAVVPGEPLVVAGVEPDVVAGVEGVVVPGGAEEANPMFPDPLSFAASP